MKIKKNRKIERQIAHVRWDIIINFLSFLCQLHSSSKGQPSQLSQGLVQSYTWLIVTQRRVKMTARLRSQEGVQTDG